MPFNYYTERLQFKNYYVTSQKPIAEHYLQFAEVLQKLLMSRQINKKAAI